MHSSNCQVIIAAEKEALIQVFEGTDDLDLEFARIMSERPELACSFSRDGFVDVNDLVLVLLEWGESASLADVATDGSVDVVDLLDRDPALAEINRHVAQKQAP